MHFLLNIKFLLFRSPVHSMLLSSRNASWMQIVRLGSFKRLQLQTALESNTIPFSFVKWNFFQLKQEKTLKIPKQEKRHYKCSQHIAYETRKLLPFCGNRSKMENTISKWERRCKVWTNFQTGALYLNRKLCEGHDIFLCFLLISSGTLEETFLGRRWISIHN